jgi:hypothetical protein
VLDGAAQAFYPLLQNGRVITQAAQLVPQASGFFCDLTLIHNSFRSLSAVPNQFHPTGWEV